MKYSDLVEEVKNDILDEKKAFAKIQLKELLQEIEEAQLVLDELLAQKELLLEEEI